MSDEPDVPPIKDIRGGIILCEMCQPMLNGKWLVVGTYSFYRVFGDVWRSAPLQCYVKIQVETPGEYPASIKLINRALPSNRPAIHTMDFTFRVTDPLQLVELACQLPPLEVHSPCPLADMRDGHAYGVPPAALASRSWHRPCVFPAECHLPRPKQRNWP